MIDQHKTLGEKILKKSMWLYVFSFIIAPIGLITKIIVSHEISINELGILYGVISIIILLGSFNDFGMTESIQYFVPKYATYKKYREVKMILRYAFLIQIITGVIIACVLFFIADMFAQHYFKNQNAKTIIQIFSLYLVGHNILKVISTFFLSIQNTLCSKISDFIRVIVTMIYVVYIMIMDIGNFHNISLSWVIGMYVSVIFAMGIFYFSYYKKYFANIKTQWDRKFFGKIFRYALLVFLGSQSAVILSQIDIQLVIYILGTQQGGYYTNYLSIVGIPFLFAGPILSLLFPIFSELHGKKQTEKILQIKQVAYGNIIPIMLALNVFMFIFAEQIAFILFGEKFLQSGVILKYSILLVICNVLLQINFSILAAIGKVKQRVKIILIAIVFNTIGNIILIHYIGTPGAALATGMGWVLMYILSEKTLGKKYAVKFKYKFLIKNIATLCGMSLGYAYLVLPHLQNTPRVQLFFILCGLSLIWGSIFGLVNKKEIQNIVLIIKKSF